MTTTTTTTDATERPRVPARTWLLPLLAILASAAIGAALVLQVWGELPDPIAHHWGADGKANEFGPLRKEFGFAVAFTTLFPLGLLGLGAAIRQPRAFGPFAAGMGAFVSSVMFGMLRSQRGVSDVAGMPNAGGPLWIGTGAALVVGLLVWFLTRDTARHVAAHLPSVAAPHVDVAPGIRLAWTGLTRSGAGTWVGLALGTLPLVGMAVVFFALGNPNLGGFMLVMAVGLLPLLSMMWCRVTIDARGVRALGMGLIPWVRIPLEQVEEARTTTVDSPLGDFGGWGYRGKADGSGAWGVVTGAGEAVVIERAGKGPMYLTIDGAAEAAAVLNTLATRREGRTTPAA